MSGFIQSLKDSLLLRGVAIALGCAIICVAMVSGYLYVIMDHIPTNQIAWQCSGVTQQNWNVPGCRESPEEHCAAYICTRATLANADGPSKSTLLPCSLAGVPMLCTLHEGGFVSIKNIWEIQLRVGTTFIPPQLEQLGDVLVIIEPTTPDPRGK